MKKIYLILYLQFWGVISFGQDQPKHFVQLTAGRNTHGSGDSRGVSFNTVYSTYFKERFSWIAGIGATLNDGSYPLFYTSPGGETIDGSIRYTTGGIQLSFGGGYSIIKKTNHELQVQISSVFRYQSTSYPDDVSILFPAGTGLPIPVVVFNNTSPQRTFAIGGAGTVFYNYTLKNKINLGLLAGLQTDTNGDTITQILFSIGKRF
jgi:hypothetical protein